MRRMTFVCTSPEFDVVREKFHSIDLTILILIQSSKRLGRVISVDIELYIEFLPFLKRNFLIATCIHHCKPEIAELFNMISYM